MRFFEFFWKVVHDLPRKPQKALECASAAPLFCNFRIQGLVLVHIQHMKEMLLFRPIKRAIQGHAVVARMAESVFDNNVMDKQAAYRILADIQMPHFPAESANGD